jgi:beta-galactosidase/beta-glucuronidase
MIIASMSVEMVRADTAVAQFMVRITVDGRVEGCEIKGRVVGPRCKGISTVEIAFPLVIVEASESNAVLRGVIPEPNLWSTEAPFLYELKVEAWQGGRQTDTRTNMLALRDR